MTPETAGIDDQVQPFQIEASHLRGRLIRLGPALDAIVAAHDYPEPVATLLAETVVLAGMLASVLKYQGIFTLQATGDGPVSTLMADVTSAGDMRGYARVDRERLPGPGREPPELRALLGKGHLAFTVDQGPHTQRYQGIVELTGGTLAECLQFYFRQSEQIDAGLKVAVGRRDGHWRGGGLMVQRLPEDPGTPASDRQEDWRRAMILMGSCTADELLDPGLSAHGLLYRLFHEDGVRVYAPVGVQQGCRCSRERIANILASFSEEEVTECVADNRVVITCEFCNTKYTFDRSEVEALFRPGPG
ncbi:MAG: molecular chaperone Hsp33 [Alphaproteobacteria bacterium]|jgi:molecular chaperone Hsp33|nr:molecular chaperone Hsp33 [Alphaproteobacteria bacterium]